MQDLANEWYYVHMNKKWIVGSILVLALIWGAALRLYNIGEQSYWIDEAYSIAIAEAISQHGYPLLGSGEVIWRSSVYHYLLAVPVAVFGTSELSARILSIGIGVLTILLVGYISKKWFSPKVAIIVMVLMSFSYWEIAWSRQARMYILFQLLFWLAVFLFERWQNKKIHLLWFVLVTILTIVTHRFGFLLPWFFVLALYLRWAAGNAIMQSWKFIAGYVGIIIGSVIISGLVLKYVLGYMLPFDYWQHYTQFMFAEYGVIALLAIAGILIMIKNTHLNTMALWLIGMMFIGLGIFSYDIQLLQYRYLFVLLPALYLSASYFISRLPRQKIVIPLVVVVLAVLAPSMQLLPQSHYYLESDKPSSDLSYKSFTPQPDFKAAYKAIAEYNPEVLITPYPAVTKLYSEKNDDYALAIDLTGTGAGINDYEVYTNTPIITVEVLKEIRGEKKSGVVLVDYLAQKRINNDIRQYIETELTPIYSDSNHDWSSIALYAW